MIVFDKKNSIEDILINDCMSNKIESDNSLLIYSDNYDALKQLLLSKKGKIDLVYIDPPFNTNQVFSITDNRVSTISRSKKGKIAYSDQMSKDDFLSFMYDRFVLIHELLSNNGSLYVHIDCNMGHYFKIMLDEIFGDKNFKNDITRIKSNPKNFDRKAYGNIKDMILFYSKDYTKNIWNDIRIPLTGEDNIEKRFSKIDVNGRRYTTIPLHAPGESNGITGQPWRGMLPPEGRHWRTNPEEFDKMDAMGLIEWSSKGNPRIIKYADEHKGKKIQDLWEFKDPQYPVYPTEKNIDMLSLIIKQSSNINSYVLDCFAGSGTTLLAAALNTRKFIGIDNSLIAIETIKNKLKGYEFDYFELNKDKNDL